MRSKCAISHHPSISIYYPHNIIQTFMMPWMWMMANPCMSFVIHPWSDLMYQLHTFTCVLMATNGCNNIHPLSLHFPPYITMLHIILSEIGWQLGGRRQSDYPPIIHLATIHEMGIITESTHFHAYLWQVIAFSTTYHPTMDDSRDKVDIRVISFMELSMIVECTYIWQLIV